MSIDWSEQGLEDLVTDVLTGETAAEPRENYGLGDVTPGGYRQRTSEAYDRDRCLIPKDAYDFVVATQPETWRRLRQHYADRTRERFAQRLSSEVEKRGVVDVLRNGVTDRGCDFEMVFFRPETSKNPALRDKYKANVFTVVPQLRYQRDGGTKALDLGLFLNGLPLFTAELKNPSTRQNYRDAIRQYKDDRDPREPLFRFRRCVAHFAVGTEEVHMTTHLEGEDTTFLPFNRGYDHGSGNPPSVHGPRTSYLWEQVWAPDSVLNLLQDFVAEIEERDNQGRRTGETTLIFPRYHQLRAVRRLVRDARQAGPGERYLVQHSAGSGKSISIAVLAHQLAFLRDAEDDAVFDTVIVVTDRRVLDKQIADVILQFERTRNVVANVQTGASGLAEALEAGKKIIVVTLQTFPYVSEAIRQQTGRRFAVVVDEAHSSQSGEYRKHLHDTLSVNSLDEATDQEGDLDPTEQVDELLLDEVQLRGSQPNVSTFAFTATPKARTLELFGEPQPDGSYKPFDIYPMRQAIEENFILDVLKNYTTRSEYWRLLKKVEDDPRYDQSEASRMLKRFVREHEETVRHKAEMMLDHFDSRVAHRIAGQAKAMVVTRSRLHAVRYKRLFERLLEEYNMPYQALVAFSGTVEDRGKEYTEAGMNGFSDSQTRHAFEDEDCRFLIVANKFQTGFDQPLLHTMYVDKKLGGVNAVQTLSRLNRTHPQKEETIVLDFVNEADAIQKAFEPYYETTTLSEGTDPNVLHDLERRILAHGIVTEPDLDRYAEIDVDTSLSESEKRKRAEDIVNDCVDRYDATPEDEQDDFREALGKFIRLYAFLAQVLPYDDVDLEKLYRIGRPLLSQILAHMEPSEVPRELLQYVDLESYRTVETHTGDVGLSSGSEPLPAQKEHGGDGRKRPSPEEALSEILRLLNERFGYDFTEGDRDFIKRLQSNIFEHDAVRTSIEVNGAREARLTFNEVAEDELQDLIDDNFTLYKKIVDNDAFARLLFDHLFDRCVEAVEEG